MKVIELISRLQKEDPYAIIIVAGKFVKKAVDGHNFNGIEGVKKKQVIRNETDSWGDEFFEPSKDEKDNEKLITENAIYLSTTPENS